MKRDRDRDRDSDKESWCGGLYLCLCLFVLLVGCSQVRVRYLPKPSDEEMKKEVDRLSSTTALSDRVSVGSLWPADDHVFFYGDKKALNEGDILTVSIVETATAKNSADTDLSRNSSIKARVNSLFGARRFLNSKLAQDLLDATAENSHVGKGSTSRKGELTASMTVVVQRVLANGNLVVQGSREVVVNHEEQFLTLTGIVRPEDINRDNVVLSTNVANARITIGGIGVVDDKQKSGWGIWIFDWLWPF